MSREFRGLFQRGPRADFNGRIGLEEMHGYLWYKLYEKELCPAIISHLKFGNYSGKIFSLKTMRT